MRSLLKGQLGASHYSSPGSSDAASFLTPCHLTRLHCERPNLSIFTSKNFQGNAFSMCIYLPSCLSYTGVSKGIASSLSHSNFNHGRVDRNRCEQRHWPGVGETAPCSR